MAAITVAGVSPARADQQVVTVRGQLYHAVSLAPVPDAVVFVQGLDRATTSDRSGHFALSDVPPGQYRVVIAAPGFQPWESDVTVPAGGAMTLDIALTPQLHYSEVISVSPESRSQFEAYQPTAVLQGQDLAKELGGTIGATLATQPGMAERTFGPGPARPVIRGLDGDRVLIFEDGQRMGDLSSQSADHGVTTNPAAVTRLEVVRGPATLLYGSSAIGGLVNAISDAVPSAPQRVPSGGVIIDFGSAATAFGAAADIAAGNGRWALRAGGSGRVSDDVRTPDGEVDNSQSRAGQGTVGVAWTGDRSFAGASYGYQDTRYGIPVVEEGQIELTPRRHLVDVRAGAAGLDGFLSAYKASLGVRSYRHEEVSGDEVHTRFENDTIEGDVRLTHRPLGRLGGTVGAWGLTRAFSAEGEEALSPPVDETGAAAFVYEEVTWQHAALQFGGRLDYATFAPAGGELPDRTFTDFSGSVGFSLHPAGEQVSLAASVASAARHPALEELYFFGPHPGNFAFEIGNPNLGSERALGVDLSFRWNTRRFSGEVTYFRNRIDDFVYRHTISEEEFDEKYGHEAHEGHEEGEGDGHEHGEEELPFVEFVAADSLLQGVEVHTDMQIAERWFADLGVDFVRGELRASKDPLPRMPPLRVRGSLRYQANAFQGGAEVIGVADQDRVSGEETPTDGYALLKLFAAYSFARSGVVHTLTVRLDNVTNELYRNHLSYIKDFVPEMGRNFKVIWGVRF